MLVARKPAPKMPQPTAEMKQAYNALLLAIAHQRITKVLVQGFQQQVIAANDFRYSDAEWVDAELVGTRISKLADIELARDEDFKAYDRQVWDKSTAYGFQLEPGYCALLMAQSAESAAERALMNASQGYINQLPGVQLDVQRVGGESRKKLVALLLQAINTACNKK